MKNSKCKSYHRIRKCQKLSFLVNFIPLTTALRIPKLFESMPKAMFSNTLLLISLCFCICLKAMEQSHFDKTHLVVAYYRKLVNTV